MIKRLFSRIGSFAKRRPSLFIVIVLAILMCLFFITYEGLHLTSVPGFCKICHVEEKSGPGGEYYTWKENVHSYVNVGCIDCHGAPGLIGYGRAKLGGLYDLYGELFKSKEHKRAILIEGATSIEYAAKLMPSERCLFCHSDSVNKEVRENTVMSFLGLEMRDVDKVVNPAYRESYGLPDLYKGATTGVDPKHETHMVKLKLSCENCHQGVAHAGQFYNQPKMETCFTCHDTERPKTSGQLMPDNDACATCHVTVLEEQEGTFLESKGIEATPWMMPSITGDCASCHVDAFTLPTVQSCIDCHDESYAEMYTMFRSDFDEQKAKLEPVWLELFGSLDKMNNAGRAKFNELNYFYKLIYLDSSKGIHNTDLMNSIFEKANTLAGELKASIDRQK